MNSLSKQKGTAVIVALFLVGLVAVIAINMMTRLNRDIQRTELLINSTQANLYAQGSVAWALDTLRNNQQNQKKDQPTDRLPLNLPTQELNHFKIRTSIYDAQGLFNLNNLSTASWVPDFQRLLLQAYPPLGQENALKIAKSVVSWITAVTNGDDDQYYAKLSSPYRIPHHLMASASEFRLIKGVTPELYTRVLPYIITLPENTLINVNTAPGPVLQSLGAHLSAEGARNIEAVRRQTPFSSTEQFLNLDVVRNNAIPGDKITVNSQYFLIKSEVEKNEQHLRLYTLAQRLMQNNKVIMFVLWQSKGE